MSDGGFGADPIPGVRRKVSGSQATSRRFGPDNAGLRVLNGPAAGRVIRIGPERSLLGRNDPPAVIVEIDLTDCECGTVPMVSRRHAEMGWNSNVLEITDLCSTNGTWVNGRRLDCVPPGNPSSPVSLDPGCVVRLGDLEMEIIQSET